MPKKTSQPKTVDTSRDDASRGSVSPAFGDCPSYPAFLADLKTRIQQARLTAGRAVNRELILLYWDIGRSIVEKQQTAGWGDAVVERLASDLRATFPDMRGFSARSIWEMKRLFMAYTEPEFLQQAVAELRRKPTDFEFLPQAVAEIGKLDGSAQPAPEILSQAVRELVAAVPWGHHRLILDKATDPVARLYYLRATAQLGWSRSVLLNQIKAQTYEHAVAEKKTHNFGLALPAHLAEHAGKMDFYLNLLNEKERGPDDQPSIGVILCAEKDDIEVEFALKTKNNPIGVAEYQLQPQLPSELEGRLPTARQLADAVRDALEEED